jgi:hypothetical protein
VLGYAGLILPLLALVLGCLALREIETKPHTAGRGIAITGLVTSLVTAFLTVVWVVLIGRSME